jgi:hypothetical protein
MLNVGERAVGFHSLCGQYLAPWPPGDCMMLDGQVSFRCELLRWRRQSLFS